MRIASVLGLGVNHRPKVGGTGEGWNLWRSFPGVPSYSRPRAQGQADVTSRLGKTAFDKVEFPDSDAFNPPERLIEDALHAAQNKNA